MLDIYYWIFRYYITALTLYFNVLADVPFIV